MVKQSIIGDTSLVILAGGLGNRIKTISGDKPKCLIEIDGKPFIYHQLNLLKEKGIQKIIVATGHKSEAVIEFLDSYNDPTLEITISHDGPSPLGTGGAIKKALNLLSEPFLFTYGDTLLLNDYQPLFKNYNSICTMMVYKNENRYDTSNVSFINDLVFYSKSKISPAANYIDYGVSLISKKCFEAFSGKFDLAEVLEKLSRDKKITGVEASQRFYEIGTPQGLLKTEKYIVNNTSRYGS